MTEPKDKCTGCGENVGLTKLVLHKGLEEQVWHVECYKQVQRILAMEEIDRERRG